MQMTFNTSKLLYLGLGKDKLTIQIRNSLKAKRVSIKLASTGNIELIVPPAADIGQAVLFLKSKETQIRDKLKSKSTPTQPIKAVPIFGKLYKIALDNNGSIDIEMKEDVLIVPSIFKNNLNQALKLFLETILYKEIFTYAKTISSKLKVLFKKITLRDPSSMWGSCSDGGNLSFSWRLIFAPRFIMEYIVVHELCHLIEMNHSSRFWQLVERVCPEYPIAEIWLKKNGANLYQIFKS